MFNSMNNPQAVAIRKYLFDILKERYGKNSSYIERLASSVITKEDYESLGVLVADLYEAGFMRAMDQYKEQLAKVGMKVSVVPEARPAQGKPIFGG